MEQRRLGEQQKSPSEAHAGSVPLRQPVASSVSSSLHAPNGILSNPDVGNMGPLGAPNGPPTSFPSPQEAAARNYANVTQSAIPQPLPLATVASSAQQVNGSGTAPQGQQPILNDALTYLDQVKVRFQTQPDVYNKFLDIMKDFKSQAIDTPGVIGRVSQLFSGHPHLIQGFNTFLPPGYKIEAGWGNDPNNIRVYTPLGQHEHNTASMPLLGAAVQDGAGDHETSPRQNTESIYRMQEDGSWTIQGQRDVDMDEQLTPGSRARHSHMLGQRQPHLAQYPSRDEQMPAADAAALAHQQEQRGVSSLSSAVNVAADSSDRLAAMHNSAANQPTLAQAQNGISAASVGQQLSLEKRGPVEFNHAISYVNKIKNRFAQHPEIYKQFLEILQTYQRESKPIGDVYAQVTDLFNAAPDLLEDFKQFLPESAAQAKAQAAARQAAEEPSISNIRGDPNYVAGIQPVHAQTTPRAEKMPPIGSFAPPSGTKENKKRRGPAGTQSNVPSGSASQDLATSRSGLPMGSASKRLKTNVTKPQGPDVPEQIPSLVPALPQPMPPSTARDGAMDEIAMFDRIKKYVSNKQTFNEILKLCNLFSQELMDVNTLVSKVDTFIGQNPDLIGWFKTFVGYSGQDELIENRPAPSDSRVNLSNCRALGPSYRMLPKRERAAKCSGRDEMCHFVLNDEWASHPTWASEDSGFIAHRKNQFEEALHRMEEERHDYDFNIETCLRTIQLLEPIVQQINLMGPEERKAYKLPRGLGGQSEAIWQRVIKKLYDRQNGSKIIEDMFYRPFKVCPFLLMRLKEKVEKWKQAQREWEKVWRDQTQKMFWKSLDHQGISARAENKRSYQPKALQIDIQARYEEQLRQQKIRPWPQSSRHQLEYDFSDVEVIEDSCHMVLTYLHQHGLTNPHNHGLTAKTSNFIKSFIPAFFGLDADAFATKMADTHLDSPPVEEEDEATGGEEPVAQRARRTGNGKRDLRRGVLDPSKQGKDVGNDLDDSKESTPDNMSLDEDSGNADDSQSEQPAKEESASTRWMEPTGDTSRGRQIANHNEPFHREKYNLYANLNIYCFFRTFEMLYQRLRYIKLNEETVRETVKHAVTAKPAMALGIAAKPPQEFFHDVSPSANYYRQVLRVCERMINRGETQSQTHMTSFEESLRRFYMAHGWQLFNFDKMLGAVLKFVGNMLGNDSKDRSNEIMNLFMSNRQQPETTHQIEIEYRKQVEKLAKDGDIYRINYVSLPPLKLRMTADIEKDQSMQHASIQIFKKDDLTFDPEGQSESFNWSYYVTAYSMRDWTEGVPPNISWPFLKRNLPKDFDTDEDDGVTFLPQVSDEFLGVRVTPKNYHLQWEVGTSDRWFYNRKHRGRGMSGMISLSDTRKAALEAKFVKNAKWMAGMSLDDVNSKKAEFQKLGYGETKVETEDGKPKAEPEDQPMAEA